MPAVSKEEAEFLTAQKKLEQSGKTKGKVVEPPYYPAQRTPKSGGGKDEGTEHKSKD